LPAPIIVKKEKSILSNSKENVSAVTSSKAKLVKSEPKSTGALKKSVPKVEPSEVIENKLATAKISQTSAAAPLPFESIDADADEFNCPDYAEAIFEYYRARDKRFKVGDYIKEQPHINKQMRLLLVDWMVEVQQQLEFNHEILYLSVKLLDLYLNSKLIEKEKLQLLGGAAMLCACKFEVSCGLKPGCILSADD
jgi:hypothetical protein